MSSFRLPEATFDETSKTSIRDETGDPSLGYLKMNVDNLGATFAKLAEKGEERTTALSLYRAFSRRLELFFGGYLVDFLAKRLEEKLVYPVFSGGDDLFLIGGWREISQLAWKICQEFNQFSEFSSLLTLSGGIAFLPSKMPVVRASRMVEEVLERAKSFHYPKDTENYLYLRKDKVGIFEEVLNWIECQEALDLYGELERRIQSSDSNRAVPRAIFRKIEQSLAGFTVILNDSLQGKMRFPKIWRFLYFLCDHKEVAKRMEKILLGNALKNQNIRNLRLVLVANV
ncbi:MAG: Cas10/Cmr2 second palm domain-containing protein [Candidatus Caldatribacteriaceae bacterium]